MFRRLGHVLQGHLKLTIVNGLVVLLKALVGILQGVVGVVDTLAFWTDAMEGPVLTLHYVSIVVSILAVYWNCRVLMKMKQIGWTSPWTMIMLAMSLFMWLPLGTLGTVISGLLWIPGVTLIFLLAKPPKSVARQVADAVREEVQNAVDTKMHKPITTRELYDAREDLGMPQESPDADNAYIALRSGDK